MKWLRRITSLVAIMLPSAVVATPSPVASSPACGPWTASWVSAQMEADRSDVGIEAKMADATLRQTLRVSIGGGRIRIHLSNLMGRVPLEIDDIHVALADRTGSARIVPGSDRVVTFGGHRGVSIPAGADYVSDPVAMPVAPRAVVSVSLHLPQAPDHVTSHPGSRTTTTIAAGDHVGDAVVAGTEVDHWYLISGVDVPGCAGAVVALGDSITDGHGATTNGDDRWTDALAARLLASAAPRPAVAIVNQGIGGNRLLLDGLGPSALARLDRDVIAVPGVRTLILLEGVNDLGVLTRDQPAPRAVHDALVVAMEEGYRQIAARAHDHGIRVIGGTIMPYGESQYYHPDALDEADRAALNRWIRTSGTFDAVIDFDRTMRDPQHPKCLSPAYDSGDGLHPSPAGYTHMAEAIPLDLIR